ncbi:hypothetical protein CK203_113827 [Vitis vinifera]|uniref:Retrotransposon gag domain-containing protein n=1 Tax=Vitis vinifera TaxID=29760 RepID=A0A438CY91_VITVI|nr:hypothetical protein CK203_113827 [Vitis vinifera]
MCGGDDHLAWKRPVSSEACRGLRTAGGTPFLHVGASEGLQSLFSYNSDPVFPLFSLQLRVLGDRPILGSVPWVEWDREDTPSDIVTPPVLPVQMPATQTLHATSHDQAAVVPPIVTPVTIVEDPRSRMDRLERRIGQMRDPDEMISWDDPDDVSVATLPVGFRMPDIERYTGVGCPRIHLRLYSTVMRALGLDEAQLLTLFPLSLSGMTQRWYASLETSRRRTWEDLAQSFETMMASLEDYGQILFLLQILRKRVGGSSESYGDHHHPHSVQQYPSQHPHTVMRPSFQFQRPQTIPLAPRPPRVPYLRVFVLTSSAFHQMAGHRTDYCASLRHTIQDLIDSGAVSFPVSTTDTDLGPDMTSDSFPAYSTHAVPPLRAYTIMFWTPRALIFTGHFDIADLVGVFWDYIRLTYDDYDTEHLEIRLLQLRFTMSDEIAPITLTTLYEMMVDLTRRVERIELYFVRASIVIERSSRSSDAFIATFDSDVTLVPCIHDRPHSVLQQHSSSISLATSTRPPSGFGALRYTVPHERFTLVDDGTSRSCASQFRLDLYCMYHQSVGHHTDRCTALRHAIQDIVDSGTFGHPQSDMFPISTSAQAMHADSPSPAVPDLIDLGD